jgi:hypothetical protein
MGEGGVGVNPLPPGERGGFFFVINRGLDKSVRYLASIDIW